MPPLNSQTKEPIKSPFAGRPRELETKMQYDRQEYQAELAAKERNEAIILTVAALLFLFSVFILLKYRKLIAKRIYKTMIDILAVVFSAFKTVKKDVQEKSKRH